MSRQDGSGKPGAALRSIDLLPLKCMQTLASSSLTFVEFSPLVVRAPSDCTLHGQRVRAAMLRFTAQTPGTVSRLSPIILASLVPAGSWSTGSH